MFRLTKERTVKEKEATPAENQKRAWMFSSLLLLSPCLHVQFGETTILGAPAEDKKSQTS